MLLFIGIIIGSIVTNAMYMFKFRHDTDKVVLQEGYYEDD